MKRIFITLVFLILMVSLCACNRSEEPISTTRPVASYEPNPEVTSVPEEPEDIPEEPEAEPTEDVRDEPETIRQEIANMLRDAEDLIAEGLYDDAKMVLRDLRSRDLTEAESEQVKKLLSELVSISD